MKAMQIQGLGGSLRLTSAEMERPKAAKGEVLVRVRAAGVTRTELDWYPTTHRKSGESRVGAVPGHEFSGEIAELGEGVEGFAIGQEVYGMNDWFAEGATAEFCVTQPLSLAAKPSTLTHEETAALPIGALTAWQGLFERAKLQAGETVLVQGGAGAVGLFVVQLAKLHGARVIATASARTLDLVTSLGADEAIDYKTQRFEDRVKDVDVVFDTVGGAMRERSAAVMRAGGRLISIAADAEVTTDPKVRDAYFIVEPRQTQLIEVGRLIDEGKLKVFVDAVVPLADAGRAYAREISDRRGYGKVVIRI